MTEPTKADLKNSSADWILLDVLQFVNNLYLSVRVDDPLDLSMRRIFTEVVGKLGTYAHCSNGLHLLENTIYGPNKSVAVLEMHHLYIDQAAVGRFLTCAMEQRQPYQKMFSCDDGRPSYIRSQEKGMVSGTGLHRLLRQLLPDGIPFIPSVVDKNAQWDEIFRILNEERSKQGIQLIKCATPHLLVIPLSKPDDKMPGGNLGTVILWQNGDTSINVLWQQRVERLILAAKMIGGFLSRLLQTHYGAEETTYLPSYRGVGNKSVGIMFTDIRDFTPTMEIARNFNLGSEMHAFMRSYCELMSQIILRNSGRVNGFSGDGIMALFGEYNLTPEETMTAAVKAAKQMVITFDQLKRDFLARMPIQKFFEQAVEPLDFRLGIGINYGDVIFDYFGAEGSRAYSALGDHVNFAQRLESQAARHDDRMPKEMRAPILLSRPAWIAGEFNLKFPNVIPVTIQVKGKSYNYPVYQVWPD